MINKVKDIINPHNCLSKHLLALKTSSTRLQRNNFTSSKKTSWKRLEDILQDVLEEKKLLRWRLLQNALKACLEDTSWRHVLKMSWRSVLKTSGRHYGNKQNTYWGCLYLTNLNVYLTNLYFSNLYLTILRRIQNALIRTHHFNIRLILELKQHLYFKN